MASDFLIAASDFKTTSWDPEQMQPILPLILLILVVWAAVVWYRYIYQGRADNNANARKLLLGFVGILIPLTVLTMCQQSGATHRLEKIGIVVHPDIGPSVGASGGGALSSGTWVFEFSESESALLDFYRQPNNRGGWSVISDESNNLILGKDEWKLMITRGDDSAIFFVSPQ